MTSEIDHHQAAPLGPVLSSNFFQSSRVGCDFHINFKDADYWKLVIDRYDDFIQSKETQEIVPKTIHQVWIGKKVPKKYDNWRKSWQKQNPDYDY